VVSQVIIGRIAAYHHRAVINTQAIHRNVAIQAVKEGNDVAKLDIHQTTTFNTFAIAVRKGRKTPHICSPSMFIESFMLLIAH